MLFILSVSGLKIPTHKLFLYKTSNGNSNIALFFSSGTTHPHKIIFQASFIAFANFLSILSSVLSAKIISNPIIVAPASFRFLITGIYSSLLNGNLQILFTVFSSIQIKAILLLIFEFLEIVKDL